MKAEEFDDLIRHKFDQNSFVYQSESWEQMKRKLDGQTGRSFNFIWWLPLISIAAAVTVSMGFVSYMQHAGFSNQSPINSVSVATNNFGKSTIKNTISFNNHNSSRKTVGFLKNICNKATKPKGNHR